MSGCDHHAHKVLGKFRCCKCSAEYRLDRTGWTEGSGKPLKRAKCAS